MTVSTLLLRLVGPMQSWGTRSRFNIRDTEREPSKSGVLGMICAAAGIGRDEEVPPSLTELRMGVRIDREGQIEKDYQTAMGLPQSDNKGHRTETSERFYLADAMFLVGLEGEREELEQWHKRVLDPVWPLFLGRRACPPAAAVSLPDDLVDGRLETVLVEAPLLDGRNAQKQIRIVIEGVPDAAEVRRDQPLQPGFNFRSRQYTTRRVKTVLYSVSHFVAEAQR